MTFTLGEVLVLLALGAYAVYLFKALRVRELALQAARDACQREDLQLLDENVSVRRISMSRDGQGRWRVWRQYRFEYSLDGVERQTGHVIMLGYQTQALVMAESGRTLH
jgi:uncharacterized membrane protein